MRINDNKNNNDNNDVQEEAIEETGEIDEITHLSQRLEEAESKYKRALADYQNLEKRVAEQRIELIRSANKDLLLRILTIFDTLILAQQHTSDKTIEVTINHFLDILKGEGVTKVKTVGETFNPEVMEAIATEAGEEGKVIQEVRAGFILNDKLLRAAQVTVGKGN